MADSDRKKFIQQGFDTVAQGYDHPALSFMPETAKRLVAHLNLEPQQNLLDVCTGTGVVALAAAEQLTQGKVTGIDLSSGMLEQAKNKAAAMQLENTEFMQMDLDALQFSDNSFDVAASSFGLFFLEDMTQGLKNIASKVKPGGKIAISSFQENAFSPMVQLFMNCYESFGREIPPLSWMALSTGELMEAQFAVADLKVTSIHYEPLGYTMTDAQMWWDVVWNAGWRGYLNQLSEEEQKQFKEIHLAEVNKLIGEDGVWFNTEVLIAIGEKK
ncbi:2-heptaprenyl-1,4-naphthoquinone methyltransferase MenG [hydrothermal vent metagenome]|uniref:2-heptaprenyl-1,4-naphthoquinone methyltransferase MenG n=1 Tax=hydrothermal vent metagenome TaxID=652676 RepID=A0A3B0XCY7_9ZZZZ